MLRMVPSALGGNLSRPAPTPQTQHRDLQKTYAECVTRTQLHYTAEHTDRK